MVLAKGTPGEHRVVVASVEKGSPAEKAGISGSTGDLRIGNLVVASGGDAGIIPGEGSGSKTAVPA